MPSDLLFIRGPFIALTGVPAGEPRSGLESTAGEGRTPTRQPPVQTPTSLSPVLPTDRLWSRVLRVISGFVHLLEQLTDLGRPADRVDCSFID